ncbi:HTH-type transcriptional regulator DmlR [Marinomonas aquimarina]|uniref:HTH-type transcriptional regulator DmlR n=1 Tax=Marinomonas aquimarina TaxID=295068 RepID=A0A1A8TLA9_9GAMM|nr:LysR family transcriptional regulator [Marinomonas aquimarina]SBS33219.1 HTH-type transcriptional regulator DmlR [Marinomonas aquimarina]
MNRNPQILKDLPAFYWSARLLNMSEAALTLDMTKATVSKAISRLESVYQMRLMERNSRNIRLTPEGQILFEFAERVLQLADEAGHALSGMQHTPQGSVHIGVPLALSREVLAPHLAEFQRQYPLIQLRIQTSQHPIDVLKEDLDIAIIVGSMENSELIVKTLYPSQLVWVTSPKYSQQINTPIIPNDLQRHILFCETRYHKSQFKVKFKGQSHSLDLSGANSCNDPIVIREAVLQGAGITMLPNQYCKGLVENGQLVEVCHDIVMNEGAAELKMVYPSRHYRSTRVRAVTEFIERMCEKL